MGEYGDEINFKCLEPQTSAKKRFSFSLLHCAWSLFSNNNIHSRYLFVTTCIVTVEITIMWSLKVFINDLSLPCRRVKNQSSRY